MKLSNKTLLLTMALALALGACGKKDEAAPTTVPASTAPAATPAATPPPPANAPAAAPAEATPTPPAAAADATTAASGLPEACEAYLKRAAACYEKAAAANGAVVEQMKQGLEQVRTQWNAVPDKSQLGSACTMANDQFAQTVSMLGCE